MKTSSLGGAPFKKRTLKVLGTLSILAVLSLGAATYQFLYPSLPTSASNYSSSVQVGAKIKEYIMMALDTNLLALKDSAGNTVISPAPSGTEITGNVNVAVTTNTAQGYALNVYSRDNTKAMVHQDPNVPSTIAPIDTVSGYDASTGISTLSANTWGFRRNTGTISSPIYSNWYAIGANESTGTVIVNTNTGTGEYCKTLSYPLNDSGCDANTYETHIINFGANITPDLASGTYTNNVVFSAVAKSEGEKYTLRFYPNGGTGQIGPRTIINGSIVTFPTKGYTRDGLSIKGWALTQEDAEIATNNNINGTSNPTTNTIYTAGQTVEVENLLLAAIDAGQAVEDGDTASIYAVWGNQSTLTISNGNSTAIQSLTPTAGAHNYTIGTAISATCTPNTGYHCTDWTSSSNSLLPSKTGNTKTGDFTYYFNMPAGDIILTANAAPNSFTINYNSNGGSGQTTETTANYGTNVTLAESTFTAPEGKKFKEWNTESEGTGTTYTNGQTGIAPATLKSDIATTNGGSITLYAIWEDDCIDCMQNWTGCSSLSTNATIELTDNRDNNKYYVKKLPDGKCWMIENLTLSKATLTPADTNISDGRTYYLPDKNTRFATADPFNADNTTINSSILSASDSVYFGSSYSNQVQVGYRAQGTTDNNTGNAVPEDTAYYNFYTATLGFSYYQDGKTSGSSTQDICPKGWHLPWTSDSGSTRNGNAEFYTLGLAYNSDSSVWTNYIAPGSTGPDSPYSSNATVRQNMVAGDSGSLDRFANNNGAAGFTCAGHYNGTSLNYVGTLGTYWSSSVYSTYNGYRLSSNTAGVYPQDYSYKYYGYSVRCVAGP